MNKIISIKDYSIVSDVIYFEDSDLEIHLKFGENVTITFTGKDHMKFTMFNATKRAMLKQNNYKILQARGYKIVVAHSIGKMSRKEKIDEMQWLISDIIEECYEAQ